MSWEVQGTGDGMAIVERPGCDDETLRYVDAGDQNDIGWAWESADRSESGPEDDSWWLRYADMPKHVRDWCVVMQRRADALRVRHAADAGELLITPEQVEEVLRLVRSTKKRGATSAQIENWITSVCNISGGWSGPDAPWTRSEIKLAALAVRVEALNRGYRAWSTGKRPYAVELLGAPVDPDA